MVIAGFISSANPLCKGVHHFGKRPTLKNKSKKGAFIFRENPFSVLQKYHAVYIPHEV
jgi:hypothetical protein